MSGASQEFSFRIRPDLEPRHHLRLVLLFAYLILSLKASGGDDSCVNCHKASSPKLVTSWLESRHAAKGVGCAACHGDNHSTIFTVKGEVSAATCGKCHEPQLKEFSLSLHASAMDHLKADPIIGRLSTSVAEASCIACHQIGKRFPDGSQGKCNSCHSGHSFSAAEARRPEACAVCHTGDDHPQFEMWQRSKHGQLFASEATRSNAPSCITCHMPSGSHNTAVGLTLGHVGNGAVTEKTNAALKMHAISARDRESQRQVMIQNCLPCHSSRFAGESLAQADVVKEEADVLLREAVRIVEQLYADQILKPKLSISVAEERPKNSNESQPRVVLSGHLPYNDLSPVEHLFFKMAKYHHAAAFKGAYHHSPVHTHTKGFLPLQHALDSLKGADKQLRSKAHATNGSN